MPGAQYPHWKASRATRCSCTSFTARVGSIFVRHPRFGIGRRLLAEVEQRAHHSGFNRIAAGVTANAVPFFERLGYVVASHGVRTFAIGCALPVTFLRKELTGPRSGLH